MSCRLRRVCLELSKHSGERVHEDADVMAFRRAGLAYVRVGCMGSDLAALFLRSGFSLACFHKNQQESDDVPTLRPS